MSQLDSLMMNGQSQSSSAEELREEHNGGIASGESSARSSSSTVSSLMELGWTEDEHFTIERIQRTRKQLEDEIEVNGKTIHHVFVCQYSQILCKCNEYLSPLQMIVNQLTLIGQETNSTAECDQIIQDQ